MTHDLRDDHVYRVPVAVRDALRQALSDIHEGVVSFDSDEYAPVIERWLDSIEEVDDAIDMTEWSE